MAPDLMIFFCDKMPLTWMHRGLFKHSPGTVNHYTFFMLWLDCLPLYEDFWYYKYIILPYFKRLCCEPASS